MRAPHFLLAALVAAATFFGLRAAAWHRWPHRATRQAGWLGCQPAAGRVLPPAGR